MSILFCDLVGSTAQAENLDPEDVRAALARYHERVRDELERHGGTVEKFIGDAVMAIFGAPVAHEDDPERAVRAAFAIRDWAIDAPEVEVRIGITTGEVLVALDARPELGEAMASGDVVNVAARLQSAAPVNGILVDDATYRTSDRPIVYREVEAVEAKGKAEPVTAWEAVEARSRFGIDVAQAPRAALVGRERELRLLHEAFERAREEHEPQVVTLVGVPGIGKSRVVYELAQLIEAEPELIAWRQGRCLPYGEGVSFWALAEMVKAEAGILESDDSQTVARKLSTAISSLGLEDAGWVETRLRPLVGLEGAEASQGTRDEGFPAWRRFLEGIGERGPAVLVFEDLHWADEGLLDFLDELADWSGGVPLLVLCTARPELLAKRPTWGGGRTNSATLSLPPLSPDDTARLAHNLLERAVLPAEVQRAVVEHADGNPLYAEEFARMVADRDDAELSVPETVQGIIAARLDALDPEHKKLVQNAAVIGKVFWSGAVAALDGDEPSQLDSALRELERRQLVRRERRSSVEGEVEFAFVHALVRDVAYGQIPRAERSVRHRAAAEWLASLGRTDDHAEVLAHHYVEALDYARAAGRDTAELGAGARIALREAGERALALGAYQSAVRYFAAALDLVGADDPERGEMLFRLSSAQNLWDGTGGERAAEAVSLLRGGDPETAASAALVAARAAWMRGDGQAKDRWVGEVDALLTTRPESMVRTEVLVQSSVFRMLAGENEEAIRLGSEALSLLDPNDRPDLYARALGSVGSARVARGDEGGLEDLRRSIEIAREGRALYQFFHLTNNLSVALFARGRVRDMTTVQEEWRRSFDEFGGSRHSRDWFAAAEATRDYLAGRWDQAGATIDAFVARIPEGESHYLETDVRLLTACMELARDRVPEARAEVERAAVVAVGSGDPQVAVPSLCMRAIVRLEEGQTGDALLALEELIGNDALTQGLATSALLPAFAWLAVDLDRDDPADRALDPSAAPRWAESGRAILSGQAVRAAELLDEIGHRPAAAYARLRAGGDHVQRALEFYESVGAHRRIREVQSVLGRSA